MNIREYIHTHLFYIVFILGLCVGFRVWLSVHDHDVLVSQQLQVSRDEVKTLRQQMVAEDAAARQKVTVVTKIVHDARTPDQVVAAIPDLTSLPLHARALPNEEVAVNAPEFVALLGQCKIDATNLGACSANLNRCEQINSEKDHQAKLLKKSFRRKLWDGAKTAAITIALWEGLKIARTGKP